MICLGLDPETPDIRESCPTTRFLFLIVVVEIFDMAFGNHLGKMLMMFVAENVYGCKDSCFSDIMANFMPKTLFFA